MADYYFIRCFIYLCHFGVICNVCEVFVNMKGWIVLLKLAKHNSVY